MGVSTGKGVRKKKDKHGGGRIDFIFLTHWDGFNKSLTSGFFKKKHPMS